MINNLEGMKFGNLEVIKCLDEEKSGKSLWECQCDCGKMIKVRTDSLTSGRTISCGCSKSQPDKIKLMVAGLKITDHTSTVFFKNTISKNNTTGINGVSKLKSGKYREPCLDYVLACGMVVDTTTALKMLAAAVVNVAA